MPGPSSIRAFSNCTNNSGGSGEIARFHRLLFLEEIGEVAVVGKTKFIGYLRQRNISAGYPFFDELCPQAIDVVAVRHPEIPFEIRPEVTARDVELR